MSLRISLVGFCRTCITSVLRALWGEDLLMPVHTNNSCAAGRGPVGVPAPSPPTKPSPPRGGRPSRRSTPETVAGRAGENQTTVGQMEQWSSISCPERWWSKSQEPLSVARVCSITHEELIEQENYTQEKCELCKSTAVSESSPVPAHGCPTCASTYVQCPNWTHLTILDTLIPISLIEMLRSSSTTNWTTINLVYCCMW